MIKFAHSSSNRLFLDFEGGNEVNIGNDVVSDEVDIKRDDEAKESIDEIEVDWDVIEEEEKGCRVEEEYSGAWEGERCTADDEKEEELEILFFNWSKSFCTASNFSSFLIDFSYSFTKISRSDISSILNSISEFKFSWR